MSTAHIPEASTSTRLDASLLSVAHQGPPIASARNIFYPSMYPFPEASQPPSVLESNIPLPAFSPSVPGSCDAGGVYYDPNFQGHNMYSQASFIPPMEDSALPINHANLSEECYPFMDMLLGVVQKPPGPLPVLSYGQHQQPDANSACSGRDVTHVETLSEFVAKYPNAQFPKQSGANIIDAIPPSRPDAGQSSGQSSSANNTSELPSASSPIPGRSTGKRRRSEDEECTAAVCLTLWHTFHRLMP